MRSYILRLQCSLGVPTDLQSTFEIASDEMAKEYAKKTLAIMASAPWLVGAVLFDEASQRPVADFSIRQVAEVKEVLREWRLK